MPIEIERKFLVNNDEWRSRAVGTRYCQGYLSRDPARTVRVRIAGDRAYLTIKGPSEGIRRAEFEYAIPVEDAEALLQLCDRAPLEKIRYRLSIAPFVWEIDEFLGVNQGLIIAEIELQHADQEFPRPAWLGMEVSGDPRYYNASLVAHPYSQWREA
jgi:adenylate cyclase